MAEPIEDDDGSILPLILGYALLAIAVLLVCVCATDLYIAQKRLDALADAAALAGTDGYALVVDGESAQAHLTDEGVHEQAAAIVSATAPDARVLTAEATDGISARVTVATVWHPPVLSAFVPGGVDLQATGTSRTALQ